MEEYGENPDPKYEKYERYQAEKIVNEGILDKNQSKDYSKSKKSDSELSVRRIKGIREMLEKK